MRGLIRRRPGLCSGHREDGGAIAVLVAVVLGMGVLLGASAIVVDVGRIYTEREQLQSGADAAALVVAENCARVPGSCGNQNTTAASFAAANAKDGTAAATVCGRVIGATGLNQCAVPPNGSTALSSCIGTRPAAGNYIEVQTSTKQADGSTLLPPSFARALTGNRNYQGTQVKACARAGWGAPLSGTGLSLTFSTCEWGNATAEGAVYGTEVPLYIHKGATCKRTSSGQNAPGGFGWLQQNTSPCQSTASVNGVMAGDTGNSTPGGCVTALNAAISANSVVFLPIFDTVSGSGSNTSYHVAGIAPFRVTGYFLGNKAKRVSTVTGANYCGGADRCVYGYFTQKLMSGSGAVGTASFGATIVALVG